MADILNRLRFYCFFNEKGAAIVGHVFNGSVWIFLLIISRLFFEDSIKDIVFLQAEFVFYSFLMSLGFCTAVRKHVYDSRGRDIKYLYSIFFFILLFLVFLGFFFEVVLFIWVAVFNFLSLRQNECLANKDYKGVFVLSVLSGTMVLFFVFFKVLGYDFFLYLISWPIMFFVLFHFWDLFCFDFKFDLIISSLKSTRSLFVSFPVRLFVYAIGLKMALPETSVSDVKIYADLLVVFGIYAFLIGRVVLFSEVVVMGGDGREAGRLLKNILFFGSLVYSVFLFYGKGDFYAAMLPFFFISRDIYSIVCDFKSSTATAILYCSWLLRSMMLYCFYSSVFFDSISFVFLWLFVFSVFVYCLEFKVGFNRAWNKR